MQGEQLTLGFEREKQGRNNNKPSTVVFFLFFFGESKQQLLGKPDHVAAWPVCRSRCGRPRDVLGKMVTQPRTPSKEGETAEEDAVSSSALFSYPPYISGTPDMSGCFPFFSFSKILRQKSHLAFKTKNRETTNPMPRMFKSRGWGLCTAARLCQEKVLKPPAVSPLPKVPKEALQSTGDIPCRRKPLQVSPR